MSIYHEKGKETPLCHHSSISSVTDPHSETTCTPRRISEVPPPFQKLESKYWFLLQALSFSWTFERHKLTRTTISLSHRQQNPVGEGQQQVGWALVPEIPGAVRPVGTWGPEPPAMGPVDEAEEAVTCPEWKSTWETQHADLRPDILILGCHHWRSTALGPWSSTMNQQVQILVPALPIVG